VIVQRIAAVIGLACVAVYFAERLGLVTLPGIPQDLIALTMIALAVVWFTGRARATKDLGGTHG
jgi:hypothetical protein